MVSLTSSVGGDGMSQHPEQGPLSKKCTLEQPEIKTADAASKFFSEHDKLDAESVKAQHDSEREFYIQLLMKNPNCTRKIAENMVAFSGV